MTVSLIERRRFLQAALAAGGAAVAMPSLLADAVAAQASNPGTILVTVTLHGGNDGLNTLGPFESGRYRDLRGPLAVPASAGHFAADGLYFHPGLRRLATRFRRGDVAVVHGVGEPSLDHSHFSAMARWQAAVSGGGITRTGWLGRWLDRADLGPYGGVVIGGHGIPLHLRGESSSVTDLPVDGNGLYGSDTSDQRDRTMYRAIRRIGRGTNFGPWVDEVAATNALAIESAQAVAPAYGRQLPDGDLVPQMMLAARLINLDLGTRVLNVGQGGYDTHDDQIAQSATTGDHAELLDELDRALDAFFAELSPAKGPDVVVMLYSEFGRRAEANGSRGTDHGAGSQLIVIGRSVKGGFYGQPSPLGNLDDRGDLRVTTDFRRVYAAVLEEWLEADARSLIGRNYQSLGLFDRSNPGAIPETDLRARAEQMRARRYARSEDYLRYHSPRF